MHLHGALHCTARGMLGRLLAGDAQVYEEVDSAVFEAGVWGHMVVTVAGSTMKLYKNGALAHTEEDGQEPPSLTRVQHWVGRSPYPIDEMFQGTIGHLRFWDGEALTADHIAQLYAERIDPTPAPSPAPTIMR